MTPPYQLSVDGLPSDLFRVHALTGKESLSEAWDFEVVVTAEAGHDVEQAALGQRAVLMFNIGPEPRAFYGVVAAVRLVETRVVDRRLELALRVVPRLWLLRHRRRTRIFQRMRVPDVVTSVLGEAGIATRWQLTRAYPEREYCTQYEETDYRFLQRILSEAGIYFYFVGGGPMGNTGIYGADLLLPGDTIVCADDASCHPPVGGDDPAALAVSTALAHAPSNGAEAAISGGRAPSASSSSGAREVPVLTYLENEEARVSRFDKVTRFSLRNSVRSTMATFRDYDPMRPMVRLQSSAVSTRPFPPSPLEAAAMAAATAENAASAVAVGAASSAAIAGSSPAASTTGDKIGAALGQRGPLEVYSHHAPFLFPKWGFANDEAPRILRQKRRRASIARGECGCPDFSPGHRFALREHPAPQLDAEYVLTTVEHRGQAYPDPGRGDGDLRVYSCAFECAPAGMTLPSPARGPQERAGRADGDRGGAPGERHPRRRDGADQGPVPLGSRRQAR